jgi:hypothetical protein
LAFFGRNVWRWAGWDDFDVKRYRLIPGFGSAVDVDGCCIAELIDYLLY